LRSQGYVARPVLVLHLQTTQDPVNFTTTAEMLAAVVDKNTPRSLIFMTLFEDIQGKESSHETFRLCMLDPCNGLETLA
jgi:hypothetical protein